MQNYLFGTTLYTTVLLNNYLRFCLQNNSSRMCVIYALLFKLFPKLSLLDHLEHYNFVNNIYSIIVAVFKTVLSCSTCSKPEVSRTKKSNLSITRDEQDWVKSFHCYWITSSNRTLLLLSCQPAIYVAYTEHGKRYSWIPRKRYNYERKCVDIS